MNSGLRQRAQVLLWQMAGPGAEFREHQLEAIEDLVDGKRRVLVVQRTGWGKSAVYLIATRLMREAGAGPTLLVSPLLALMRNQIEMARRLGINAATINSSNRTEWKAIEEHLRQDSIDLLLISPERLNNPAFRSRDLPLVLQRTGLLVVDEVHCISDWGHDFRPDYRRLARVIDLLPSGVPVLGCTATANDRVIADVGEQLGELVTYRGTLDRESLALYAAELPSQAGRLAWLATYVPQFKGSGIIYCLTVSDTAEVAEWLGLQGISAVAYTGQTFPEEREQIESGLLQNRFKVVVATSALGMGFDKPDLEFVIHYQSPGSPIAYYQQVGRAGRALEHSWGILLQGREDKDIQDYFIANAFPPREQAEEVVKALTAAASPLALPRLLGMVNVRRSRLEAMLKVLEVDGAVEQVEGCWQRTLKPWRYDGQRVAAVSAARRVEQDAMRRFVQAQTCLMQFLRQELDDPQAEPCGRCGPCRGKTLPLTIDPATLTAARSYLERIQLSIKPRQFWPGGLKEVSGAIPPDQRLEAGRVLSRYGHDGMGALVERGKYQDNHFCDELVEAAARLIEERWNPQPAPAWVTSMPSKRAPELVSGFAKRLAARLGLPFDEVIEKARKNPPQKDMENSARQVLNTRDAFKVRGPLPTGPVLLVDDVIDSGWTLATAGMLLRQSGSGPIYPFALARATAT